MIDVEDLKPLSTAQLEHVLDAWEWQQDVKLQEYVEVRANYNQVLQLLEDRDE